jgi:hypothetical protein
MPMSRSPIHLPALAMLALAAAPAAAGDTRFALMLQNDVVAGNDGGGYSNGIALSAMRSVAPGEGAIPAQWLLAPVAPWLGLGPATLTVSSLNQTMVTPSDLARKIPDPADTPYIGTLWFRAAQVSVQGAIADMLALNLGLVGPASGAKRSQILIHSLTHSERPQGWDSQLPNRALIAVDRYRALRLASGGASDDRVAADLIVLGGVSVGNLQSSLGGSLLLRYGSGLQRSYPTALRAVSRSADPIMLGRGWFVYGAVHADRVFWNLDVGDAARLRESQVTAVAGLAYGWDDSSLSFSLQSTSPLTTLTGRRKSYGSLSYATLWR